MTRLLPLPHSLFCCLHTPPPPDFQRDPLELVDRDTRVARLYDDWVSNGW